MVHTRKSRTFKEFSGLTLPKSFGDRLRSLGISDVERRHAEECLSRKLMQEFGYDIPYQFAPGTSRDRAGATQQGVQELIALLAIGLIL